MTGDILAASDEQQLVVLGFVLLVALIALLAAYLWYTRHDDARPSSWYRERTTELQTPPRGGRHGR